MFDALGRRVLRVPTGAHRAGHHALRLRLDALPAGVYVVVVDADGARYTRPVVIVQ